MIYQVMIVDDDRNFRFALREMIPWEEHGFHVAAEAIHGKQALEMLEKTLIHIVITDMDMPVMNGVELTAEIRKRYPDLIIIACSAFDDFHFVKESMRLGAEDYILKQDFDGEQIIASLQEMIGKRRKRRLDELCKSQSEDALPDYLEGKLQDLPERTPGISRIRACRRLTVFLIKNQESASGMYDAEGLDILLLTKLEDRAWLLLLEQPVSRSSRDDYDFCSRTANIVSGYLDDGAQIGINDAGDIPERIPEMYQRAKEAVKSGFCHPNKKHFHSADLTGKTGRSPDISEFRNLEHWNAGQICEALKNRIRECSAEEEETNRLLVETYQVLSRGGQGQEREITLFDNLKRLYYLDDKLEYLKRVLEEWNERFYSGTHPEIRSVVRYIMEHYAEDISLGEIAAYAGLSDNYFSNLFKQETGENLTSFINRVRIEKAKNLLDESGLRVYEIAENVGFRNTTYFSTVFKKVTGMSISEYKAGRS